jgi:hypothetical protein
MDHCRRAAIVTRRFLGLKPVESEERVKFERYSILLGPVTREAAAYLPVFLEMPDTGTLVLEEGGRLRTVNLPHTRDLMEMAEKRLGGRVLTPEERVRWPQYIKYLLFEINYVRTNSCLPDEIRTCN